MKQYCRSKKGKGKDEEDVGRVQDLFNSEGGDLEQEDTEDENEILANQEEQAEIQRKALILLSVLACLCRAPTADAILSKHFWVFSCIPIVLQLVPLRT
ncbi:hypothetical protein Moror_6902 [Moniliophthora roreri MCA 2997]|uniref:Uncharacterized protein n=1 Tax=Moniliophthora roreri (strain MCA 2997) TaxID=1381753 RepID=V2XSF6_MONRO|nr:hypothetical protein Moror_6902 [Moniliophthora roreri MCA 2997]